MQGQAPSAPRSPQQLKSSQQGLVRHIAVLASDTAGSEAAPPPPSDEQRQRPSEAAEAAARAAADEAVAALSDDEAPLEPPQDPRKMGEAHFLAAAKLQKDRSRARQPKAILDLLSMAIAAQPDKAEMYHDRAVVHMELGRDKEAVQDFTVALSLPDCGAHLRYQCLLFRGRCRMDVGDLAGADADYKAAQDAAEDDRQRREAQQYRGFLTMERVRRRKEAVERQKRRPAPVQHRYRTAVIEEMEPEEGTPEQEEAVAQERARAWEEAALSLAVEAKGRAARIAREYDEEQARAREENQARQERNEVRAARRRRVAEAAAARARAEAQQAAQRAAQQAAQQPAVVVRERTEIPIEVVGSRAAHPAVAGAGAEAGGLQTSSSDTSRSSSRSTASRLAGYASESESTEPGEGEQAEEVAATAAAKEGPAAAAAGQRSTAVPADTAAHGEAASAGEGDAAAAAEQHAAAQPPAAAEAPAVAPLAAEQAEAQPPPQRAQPEVQQAQQGAQPPAATPQQAAGQAAQAPPHEPEAQPLLSEEELDRLKGEADGLQRGGRADAAEALYARYLRQRPADQRVWGNRAENYLKAERWPEVLEFCNEALAIATPTHEARKFKIFARRAAAYHGLGRLQEALRDYEAADAAAEAAGEWKPKKSIAKRIQELLAEMESKGIQAAPSDPSALCMQASAAAAAVRLPPMPVSPPLEPLAPQEEADLEGKTPGSTARGDAGPSSSSTRATVRVVPKSAPPQARDEAQSPGALLTAASHQARIRAEEAAAAKHASEEARDKGNACFKKHQWEQALKHYRRASELDPSCKLALANQAAALLKLERWDEAEDLAGQALAIDCNFTKARYRRALAYHNQGNLELAVMDMELAAGADPGDKAAQRELRAMKEALAKEQERLGLAGMHSHTNKLFDDPPGSQ
ncbi:hypothetical protein ABPG75_002381 [Micractinium tetrahymenae]